MPKKQLSILLVIMLLAASALACNTVMGGPSGLSPEDAEATANAFLDDDAQATIEAAEATAEALNGDNGNDGENENGDDNGNDNENDNENENENGDNGDTENPFGEGPDDIPVLNDNAELLAGDDTSLNYYTDASFDDTVEFYREEMPNSGWEPAPNGDNVIFEIAALQFDKDDTQALISVTTDPTSNRTLVTVLITE